MTKKTTQDYQHNNAEVDAQGNAQHDENTSNAQKNKTLLKLEELSRVHASIDEFEDLENDFIASLKCIEQLNDVDTNGVQDWFYEFTTPLYADEIKQNMPSTKEILSNTPQKEDDKIVVPKFIG